MRSTLSCLSIFLGISIFFSCKQPPKKTNPEQESNKKLLQSSKNDGQSKKVAVIDSNNAISAYNKLPTIALPFLTSSQRSDSVITYKIPTLPYTTIDHKNQVYVDKRIYLNTIDTTYLLSQLKKSQPRTVNPKGGTSFGDLDCVSDSGHCINTGEQGKIGIVCALKVNSNYLCHIVLSYKEWYSDNRGILLLVNPHGEILEWMFSDGDLGNGNSHGNIDRMFTINSNHTIRIEEYAYGDNSDHYSFYAIYKVSDKKFILQKRRFRMLKLQGE
jgi:hypothetical protein